MECLALAEGNAFGMSVGQKAYLVHEGLLAANDHELKTKKGGDKGYMDHLATLAVNSKLVDAASRQHVQSSIDRLKSRLAEFGALKTVEQAKGLLGTQYSI